MIMGSYGALVCLKKEVYEVLCGYLLGKSVESDN
jgi:hypothetical protein